METTRGRSAAVGRPELAGFFVVAALACVWSWWTLEYGAWFGVVLLPGAILLCAVVVVLCIGAPRLRGARLGVAAAIALGALIALGIWAALSALWSPAPDVAIADGQRILVYAVAFGLGAWMVALLAGRSQLSLAPLAVAGTVAGVATAIGMITTENPGDFLEVDGTLLYPLGYRNANAAFFAIAFFPALGLASSRELDWRARGLALAAATLCIGLALLSQSRGSVPAALIALGVYVIFSPLRLRAICWLVLAAAPAAGVIPALTDLFQAAEASPVRTLGDELESAGVALAWTSGASLLLGLAAARFERVIPGLGNVSTRPNLAILATLAMGVVAAVVAFVVTVGDPVDWTVKRADEFRGGTPSFSGESTRFHFNLGTNRYDLWRVAVDDAQAEPLRGTGAGGFQYSYLRGRESRSQTARDAHSVELELMSELGAPGLALLLVFLTAAAIGTIRARRFSQQRALLAAIALAAGAYWLTHASIDWFWPYAAITAPVIALLGSACAPRGEEADDAHAGATEATGAGASGARIGPLALARLGIATAAIVLALTTIPPFLSERYVNGAYSIWGQDLERAYGDLDRARDLNPLADEPLLAEGAIARAAGDRPRAIRAFRDAARKRPEEWASAYFLAEILADEQPRAARRWLARARRLNPRSREIEELAEELASERRAGSAD